MKKSHLYIFLMALLVIPGALFVASMGAGSKAASLDGYTDERPSSFSLQVGSRPSSKGFFRSLKAGLSLFGLVPKDNSEEVLKALLEETHSQVTDQDSDPSQEEENEEEEESEKELKKRNRESLKAALEQSDDSRSNRKAKEQKLAPEAQSAFIGEGGGLGPAPGASPTHQSYMNDNLPQDVEGWLARITTQRSFRVFTQFVAFFQVGHISEEIFYPVVRALLQEKDPLLVKYGVLALTGAPETESFATLIESRSVVIQDTEILQLLSQGVSAYAEPTNLPYLFVLLRNPDRTEEFHRALEITEISINNWYAASQGESGASSSVYYQLQSSLKEGVRRAVSEDLRADLQRLLSLMDADPNWEQEDVLIGGNVPN